MGKYFFALIIAGFVLAIGLTMFPSIKAMFGYNSTTGFSPLLTSIVTGLPYALVFFIFYAVWMAARSHK